MTSTPGRQERAAARRAVLVAARALVRVWLLCLAVSVALAVLSAVMTVVVLTRTDNMRAYAMVLALLTAALAYNVTRFVPRRPEDSTVTPSTEDARTLVVKVASWTGGWRPGIRLVVHPTLHVDLGVLVIGLPMLACLREHELAALVRDARAVAEPDTPATVRRALRIDRGGIGRGPWGRHGQDAWPSRFLVRWIASRADELARARQVCARTLRAGSGQPWAGATATADTVLEAWDIVVDQWLEPALRRGVWHADPSSGLRNFLAACEAAGLVETDNPRHAGPEAMTLLPGAASYERALVELQIQKVPHDTDATAWSDHAVTVTGPAWRTTLATGLDAGQRATGLPQPANLDSLLSLYEGGWGTTIAALLAPGPAAGPGLGDAPVAPAEQVRTRLLTAAVSVALLDSGAARLEWSWLYGAVLRHQDGRTISVSDVVADPETVPGDGEDLDRLRAWLSDLGLDLTAPLSLTGGIAPGPRPLLLAVGAFRGMRT